ncbi:MAG: PadR family transcriptional regulator [Gammaproteobacteria bacterium]|jgi:DNA-binding PadR family transcriptional regulator
MSREHKTKYAILGALSVKAMSGYDIKQWVKNATGTFWAESSGQVYPELSSLLKAGLIKIDKSLSEHANRAKKLYSITKSGLDFLINWLVQPASKKVERNELRLKLFYGRLIPKENYLNHIERLKVQIKEAQAHMKIIEKNIRENLKSDDNSIYWLLTLKCGFMHAKTELDWCDKVIKVIRDGEKI